LIADRSSLGEHAAAAMFAPIEFTQLDESAMRVAIAFRARAVQAG
jgi:hypothetical protein